MKHAILIMAHKNFTQLRHLVEYFSRDCYVFIHIDKKGEITPSQANELMGMANVTNVYRKYAVHWGGFSILKCEMFLLKQVLIKQGMTTYIMRLHIIIVAYRDFIQSASV